MEVYMKLVVYFMLILMVLRFMAEIKVAIECKCGSTVVPQNQVERKKPSMEEEIEDEREKKKNRRKLCRGRKKQGGGHELMALALSGTEKALEA